MHEPRHRELETTWRDAGIVSRGHFAYESGHHGDLWLDLDRLLADEAMVFHWAAPLARQIRAWSPDVVCGPETGGALLARLLAKHLDVTGIPAQRSTRKGGVVRYRIGRGARAKLEGRRTVLVDDAINAGSALVATERAVRRCGADVIGVAALMVLGDRAERLADRLGVERAALLRLESELWAADDCPLCKNGQGLDGP